jgi:transcriptional regulator with XRE-family HTH domain
MRKKPERTVWDRAKEAMQEKGLPATQKYLAERMLGISQASVAEWNRPDGSPTMARAREIAEKLDICVEWLLTERGSKRPKPDDEQASRLWELWPRLDLGTRGELIGMAIAKARPLGEGQDHSKSA